MNDSSFCKDCYGVIERVWPWSGLVSFPLGGRIEQAYFHSESVLIDNREISPSLNLMDILRGGMSASLRVTPSHTGTDIRFIAIWVHVSSFESFNSVYNSETEILNEAHYSESFNMAGCTQIAPPNDSDIYFDNSDTIVNVTPINQCTNEDNRKKNEDHQNKAEDLPRPTALPHKESNETIKVVTFQQEQQRITTLQSKDQINRSFARKKEKKRKKFNSKRKTFHYKPDLAPHTLRLNKDLNNRNKAKTFQQQQEIFHPKRNLSRPMISQTEPDLTPEQWLEEFF